LERLVPLPVEVVVDHDAARRTERRLARRQEVGVGISELVGEAAGIPAFDAVDRPGIRIEQDDVRIEAMPGARLVRTPNAIAVALSERDPRDVHVKDVRRLLPDGNARLVAGLVEQAELHRLRVRREQREVRSVHVPRRAERARRPRKHLHLRLRIQNREQSAERQ
jgi:hypothetical protein